MLIIHVAKPGQPAQQYTLAEANRLIEKGELSLRDRAWHEGLPDWVELERIRGIAVGEPTTKRKSGDRTEVLWGRFRDHADIAELWNPWVGAAWSILLSPLFGFAVIYWNWKSVGEGQRAKLVRDWIWAVSVCYAGALLLLAIDSTTIKVAAAAGLGIILMIWMLVSCFWQAAYIRRDLQGQYFRRSWWKPIGIGLLFLAFYLLAIWVTVIILKEMHRSEFTG